jgi:hypothetical protein
MIGGSMCLTRTVRSADFDYGRKRCAAARGRSEVNDNIQPMSRRRESLRMCRVVSASLAVVWLSAGIVGLALGALERRWLLVSVAAAALWYGVIWACAARKGHLLTSREALMPWRIPRRPDA